MLNLKSTISLFLAAILTVSFNPLTLSGDDGTEHLYIESMTQEETAEAIDRIANGGTNNTHQWVPERGCTT